MKKPIILKIPKCGKCKKVLEPEFTTEQGEGDKGKPQVLMMYGRCNKCNTITMCDIIKLKDIPNKKDFEQFANTKNSSVAGKK